MWKYVMRMASFCADDNESFKRGVGCVCDNGKHCLSAHTHGEKGKGLDVLSTLSVIVSLFTLWSVISIVPEQGSLRRLLERVEKKISFAIQSA